MYINQQTVKTVQLSEDFPEGASNSYGGYTEGECANIFSFEVILDPEGHEITECPECEYDLDEGGNCIECGKSPEGQRVTRYGYCYWGIGEGGLLGEGDDDLSPTLKGYESVEAAEAGIQADQEQAALYSEIGY